MCGETIAGPTTDHPGAPLFEIRAGTPPIVFLRCAGCATRYHDAQIPDPFPERPDVPVPTLPIELVRRPDFVTAGQAATSAKRFIDRKMRQTGDDD